MVYASRRQKCGWKPPFYRLSWKMHRYIVSDIWNVLSIRVFHNSTSSLGGPGSSVGIATDYGLDGPVSNPGGDEIFRPSRPALGSTQPPVKWVQGLSQG